MSAAEADAEISSLLSELENLMGTIRSNVTALQSILTTEPEVTGGNAVSA